MKRILIADDHFSVRKGVKMVLGNAFNQIEFEDAVNASEIFKKVEGKNLDMIILDMNMPGRNGMEVLKQFKKIKVNIPVLVFSMHPAEQFAAQALKLGAFGYLSKDATGEELANAVQQILAGKKQTSLCVAEDATLAIENGDDKLPHEYLSAKEYQTLLFIASGKTVSEIAKKLSLSVSSISTFRTRILRKMQMKTNSDLTRYAITNCLVE